MKIFLWEKIYFVANRNLEAAERQLGDFLKNTKVIDNPISITDSGIRNEPSSLKLKTVSVARYDCDFKALSEIPFTCGYELNFYGSGMHKAYLKRLVKHYELKKCVREKLDFCALLTKNSLKRSLLDVFSTSIDELLENG